MTGERYARYPNPNAQVHAAIEYNRHFRGVTVRRGSHWETTAVLLRIADLGKTRDGRPLHELITDGGRFLVAGVAVGHYRDELIGCRVRLCWTKGDARRFVTLARPVVAEQQPTPPKPPRVGWSAWHARCRIALGTTAPPCPSPAEDGQGVSLQAPLEQEGR